MPKPSGCSHVIHYLFIDRNKSQIPLNTVKLPWYTVHVLYTNSCDDILILDTFSQLHHSSFQLHSLPSSKEVISVSHSVGWIIKTSCAKFDDGTRAFSQSASVLIYTIVKAQLHTHARFQKEWRNSNQFTWHTSINSGCLRVNMLCRVSSGFSHS